MALPSLQLTPAFSPLRKHPLFTAALTASWEQSLTSPPALLSYLQTDSRPQLLLTTISPPSQAQAPLSALETDVQMALLLSSENPLNIAPCQAGKGQDKYAISAVTKFPHWWLETSC